MWPCSRAVDRVGSISKQQIRIRLHMNDQSDRHRKWLDRKHAATSSRIECLTQSFDEIVRGSTGVAIDDEHDPEGHTIAWERQQVAALLDEARSALAELVEAQERIAAGTYGLCLECGDTVSGERLEALPATTTCILCAKVAHSRPHRR